MNILSLFDGMSCGQIALKKADIKVDTYFASETNKYAIAVTMCNFPNTIQLGDILKIDVNNLPKIDLLIGGSPCQGFSSSGKQLNFSDPRSILFFEFVKFLEKCNPKYFLFENVKMKKEWQDRISGFLEVKPIEINSNLLSAQNRKRLYWTNIPNVTPPKDKGVLLKDVWCGGKDITDKFLAKKVGTLAYKKAHQAIKTLEQKSRCLLSKDYGISNSCSTVIKIKNKFFRPDVVTCERLQTVPDNYTSCVSNTQRYKMLGNGWTVDIIAHILKGIPIKNIGGKIC